MRLRTLELTKKFGSTHHSFTAVDRVSLEFGDGRRTGIVGESGSGKSTLSRMLCGLTPPSAGLVEFDGKPLPEVLATRAGTISFRRAVQFVAQDTTSSFDPLKTLRESLRYSLRILHGRSKAQADSVIDETLGSLGIDPALADRKPTQVSGGQRQRFSLARALVVQPSVLICDEVVSALDVSVQGQILNYIKQFCENTGASLVFVSHGLPATAFLCDELVVMYAGNVVESGSTSTVIHAPTHAYTARLLDAFSDDVDADIVPIAQRGFAATVDASIGGHDAAA
jgi:peptide/nickel transport system ATP-binding protein